MNAAGTVIPSGEFDPFVGVFDSSGDLIQGTSDVHSNYPSFTGCPPLGLLKVKHELEVTIGSVTGNWATSPFLSPWHREPIPSSSRTLITFQTPFSIALPPAI
jgi:hypothetical protein